LLPVTASRVSIPDFFNPNIFLPNQCFFFLVHQKGAVEKERSSWNARPYQAKKERFIFSLSGSVFGHLAQATELTTSFCRRRHLAPTYIQLHGS
jgi:hypothetical protein